MSFDPPSDGPYRSPHSIVAVDTSEVLEIHGKPEALAKESDALRELGIAL